MVDRAPKSPLFFLFTASKGVIEIRAPNPATKKEWLLWVCRHGKKKNVVRTFNTIAVRDQLNKDETPLNKQAQKKAQEEAKRREVERQSLAELPIWKHPAYIGHFCDVSFPSISYEAVFTLNDKLEVDQQIQMLKRIITYSVTTRRNDLTLFNDDDIKTARVLPNLLEILKFFHDDLSSAAKTRQRTSGATLGMSRFLLKFTNALKVSANLLSPLNRSAQYTDSFIYTFPRPWKTVIFYLGYTLDFDTLYLLPKRKKTASLLL